MSEQLLNHSLLGGVGCGKVKGHLFTNQVITVFSHLQLLAERMVCFKLYSTYSHVSMSVPGFSGIAYVHVFSQLAPSGSETFNR